MSSVEMDLPRNVVLHLTEACNLRCKMCFFWGETGSFSNDDKKNNPIQLEFKLVKQLVHDLIPAKPSYSLFGGEPLLYSRIEDLILEVKQNGSYIDTPTNGTLLNKKASMLVQTGFDSIRVSLDGSRDANDRQRGKGSYYKAIAGINALCEEKKSVDASKPVISIIYTVTPQNYDSITDLFINNLDLSSIDWITIQMQNFITKEMGEAYAKFLRSEFDITSDFFWRGMIRKPADFNQINTKELCNQVNEVRKAFRRLKKNVLLLPPTFTDENLNAYNSAKWSSMKDLYQSCLVPWLAVDIVANGDVAPCHVFYDLILGNLHENSFKEIWRGEKYKKFRNYMENQKFMPICPGCCILYLSGKSLKV